MCGLWLAQRLPFTSIKKGTALKRQKEREREKIKGSHCMNAICKCKRWEHCRCIRIRLALVYISMRCWQTYNALKMHTIDFMISAPSVCRSHCTIIFSILVFSRSPWTFPTECHSAWGVHSFLIIFWVRTWSALLPSCYVNVSSDKLISFPRSLSVSRARYTISTF